MAVMAEVWNSIDEAMKRIFALALTLIICAACAKETVPSAAGDGEAVTLSLNVLSGQLDRVVVKGWDPNDANEVAVHDLRVYVFDKIGVLVGFKTFSESDLKFNADRNSSTGYDKSAYISGIQAVTGDVYIYGIANAVTSQYSITDERILNATNSDLTRKDFLAAVYSRQKESVNPMDNCFLMTGYVNDGEPVHVSKSGTGTGRIDNPVSADAQRLKLFKAVSKNKITVKTGAGISFDPDYYVICNVPRRVPVIDKNTTASYSDFENLPRTVMNELEVNFYLPENIQTSSSAISKWNDRERNVYSDGVKSFVNAPVNSTYIVIYGKYKKGDVSGNVHYTIHLGDFGKSLSDFSVVRNYKYEYTVTVNGVDDIVAEAKADGNTIIDKDNPGAEGVIIRTDNGEVFDVDCHYESRVFSFTQEEIKGLRDFGYIVKFKTAFGETESLLVRPDGLYDPSAYKAAETDADRNAAKVGTFDGDFNAVPVAGKEAYFADPQGGKTEHDYYWVHFVKNTGATSGVGQKTYSARTVADVCRFPGLTNTMNVFKMFVDLMANVDNDSYFNAKVNGKRGVYYTCFIDENYYSDRAWTEYANRTEERVVYLANTYETSPDKMSSYAEAKYVISQEPVWTFYKMDPSLVPYGVESVSEEEKVKGFALKYSRYSGTGETWDGLATTRKNVSVFYPTSGMQKRSDNAQDLYTDVFMACMSRNRDENGDGNIDASEVKWYLASVGQSIGLWSGEEILPTDARLFNPNDWDALKTAYKQGIYDMNGNKLTGNQALKFWHYFTSSDKAVLWAEEGVSTSSNGFVNSWGQASKVRCVRNLQSNGTGVGVTADKYYKTRSVDDGTEVTMLLAEDALRGYQSTAMSPSLERGENTTNKLYGKFVVASSDLPGTFARGSIINTGNNQPFISATADVCKTAKGGAWRVPNQRELSMMTMFLSNPSRFMWSNTLFTGVRAGYYKDGVGQGLIWLNTGQLSLESSGSGTVRCVRDEK